MSAPANQQKRRCGNPNTRMCEYNGGSYTLTALAAELGISLSSMWGRYKRKSPPEKLFHKGKLPPSSAASPASIQRLITHNGKTQTLKCWAEDLGLEIATLKKRLERGWPVERALQPLQLRTHSIWFRGKPHTLSELSRILGIGLSTLWGRYKKGYPPEKICYKGHLSAIADPKEALRKQRQRYGRWLDNRFLLKREHAERYGISIETVKARMRAGMSFSRAIKTPVRSRQPWVNSERRIVLNNLDCPLEELQALLPHRSVEQLRGFRARLCKELRKAVTRKVAE